MAQLSDEEQKILETEFSTSVYKGKKRTYAQIKGALTNTGLMKISRCLSSIFMVKDERFFEFVNDLDVVLSPEGDISLLYKHLTPIKIFGQGGVVPIEKQRNNIKIGKNIKAGSYGEIYLADINGVEYVVKLPKTNPDEPELTQEILKDFMTENLTASLLYCFHDEMKLSLGNVKFLQPFPRVEAIYMASPLQATRTKKYQESFAAVYQKLDMDSGDYVDDMIQGKPGFTETQFVRNIAQLMISLYFLQKSINFLHGDLHIGNVMLGEHNPAFSIEFDGGDINNIPRGEIINSRYRTYIIDLGMTCADLTKCKSCEMRKNFPSVRYGNKCSNRSHDARLYLASLYYTYGNLLPPKFLGVLDTAFNPYREWVDQNKHYVNNVEWHLFYEASIDRDDDYFYPENILKFLIKSYPSVFNV